MVFKCDQKDYEDRVVVDKVARDFVETKGYEKENSTP